MQIKRYLFFLMVGLAAICFGPGSATGQTAVSYRFLEATDDAGKPVAGATVAPGGSSLTDKFQTDAKGTIAKFPIWYGDYNTRWVRITKDGYYPGEEADCFGLLKNLLQGEIDGYDPYGPIKISLIAIPSDPNKTISAEAEQRRRELILHVQKNEAEAVSQLLTAGVSPNVVDRNGFPAILWAAFNGNEATIRALCAAGATLGPPGGPGRKVLLYFLLTSKYYRGTRPDAELVDLLIKAGADVNASNHMGKMVLATARENGDAAVISLLEKAGAK